MKKINSGTDFIVSPSEAENKLTIGEKVYIRDSTSDGEIVATIEKFQDGLVILKPDGASGSLRIPMTKESDNF